MTYQQLAEQWLEEHYPEKMGNPDMRYSAVFNFARYLDESAKSLIGAVKSFEA